MYQFVDSPAPALLAMPGFSMEEPVVNDVLYDVGVDIEASATNSAEIAVERTTIKQISQELNYFPSKVVKDASRDMVNGTAIRETVPVAERELAAKFYEGAATRVARNPEGKALNEARAKFWREGGTPPGDIHNFKKK
jgi:hypothetical protein